MSYLMKIQMLQILYIFQTLINLFSLKSTGANRYLIPYTPMSDKDKISPYSINTISSRQVIRIKKNIIRGLLIKTRPISPN